MSSIGIDFGNERCVVAVARNHGIDMILTEESKYETPTIVCFGNKQRFFGASGASSAMTNPNNTISQIKRLVGRKFSDPNLQRDLQRFPFSVTEGPDGFPLIRVTYSGEQHTFTPTQVLAMVFAHLKKLAERNLSGTVSDCCIGIPVFFTDIQRRAVLEAAKIAELNAPCLIHEMTAVALGYGIYTTDLPKSDKMNVAFVDVGHASMQVCIVEYKSGHLKILGHAFDQSLFGGRDFDRALFEHFAAKFEKEHNVDVYRNVRACARLMSACEKIKKVLSANPVAHINIECFMNEKDMNYEIKREEFEDISSSLLQRVAATLKKACEIAQIDGQSIHEVELVGSGSRVPAITRILKNVFKKEPRRTMNSSECVARGCALYCASLNPTFKGWELKVEESFPFSVAVLWQDFVKGLQETGTVKEWIAPVFPSGSPTPSCKSLKFRKSKTFSFDVLYADGLHRQTDNFITYTIGPLPAENCEVHVSILLNCNGIISVPSATLLLENETINSGIHAGHSSVIEFIAGDSANVQAIKKDLEPKGKVKIDVPISEHICGGLSSLDIQNALEKEYDMACKDKVVLETKERKNALEAYVYKIREQLNGKYQDFVGEIERESVDHKLQETEDWLYNEGEDEGKATYVAKLEELINLATPIEVRYGEDQHRQDAINHLVQCLNYCKGICSGDPQWDHIDPTEKQTVLNECSAAQRWLGMKRQEQDRLPKNVDAVLLCADLVDAANHLDRVCRTIISKPRPQQISQPSSISREAATFSRSPQQTLYRDDMIDMQKGGRTYIPLTQADPKKNVIKEYTMTFQDKRTEETKEARKALEAFVLTTRKELNGKYRDFVAPLVENLVITKLVETEHWLYKEGKDQDKAVYLSKLGELKRLSDPIEARYKDDQHRKTSISYLALWIKYYKEITCSADQRWDYIDPTEKQKVVDVCNHVEQWLNDRKLKQEHLPKYANPVLICDYLQNATDFLISVCKPIMFKPKPEQIPQPSFPNPRSHAP